MINGVSLSTIVHSTEDPTKVKQAIVNLVPEKLRSTLKVNATEAIGHYGNPISVLRADSREKGESKEIVEHIMCVLPTGDKMRIRDQMDLYYDGRSSIFLRIDKQSAFLGVPRISASDDVIRVKVSLLMREKDLAEVLKILDLA